MYPADGTLWPLLGLACALGLSHGADPDHLTAIDGMTRASVDRHPRMSRWVGTWFACGHALSVLLIAAAIALAAEYLQSFSHSVLHVSGVLSAGLLFIIGSLNLARLVALSTGAAALSHGVISHVLPRRVLNVTHPMNAVPISGSGSHDDGARHGVTGVSDRTGEGNVPGGVTKGRSDITEHF